MENTYEKQGLQKVFCSTIALRTVRTKLSSLVKNSKATTKATIKAPLLYKCFYEAKSPQRSIEHVPLQITPASSSQVYEERPGQPQLSPVYKAQQLVAPKPGSRAWHRRRILLLANCKEDTTNMAAEFHRMNDLPIEIRRAILPFLDLKTILNLRLTSRFWAEVGDEYTIESSFLFLPLCDDLSRLQAITSCAKYSNRINEIVFNQGAVNEHSARNNTQFAMQLQDPEERVLWDTYTCYNKKEWNTIPLQYSESTLTRIFSDLPKLARICVTLTLLPYPEGYDTTGFLSTVWKFPSTRSLNRVATTQRFHAIIKALASNADSVCLKSMSHDRLPLEYFAQEPVSVEDGPPRPFDIKSISAPFVNLTSLNFIIDYSDMPNRNHETKALQNLGFCIRQASELHTLCLSFRNPEKVNVSALLADFESNKHPFSHLTKLTIAGISITETQLSTFLTSIPNLISLQLGDEGSIGPRENSRGGILLREGRHADLWEKIWTKHEQTLESFKLQGDMEGWDTEEFWILNKPTEQSSIFDIRQLGHAMEGH